MSIAGTCPLCNREFPWTEVPPGATAIACPNCAVPVELERPPPPMPPPMFVPLVPTFPKPEPPPAGMAIVRADAPPAPPVLAEDGPFRSSAHPFIERRVRGALEIVFPRRRGEGRVSVGAVVWSSLWGLLAVTNVAGVGWSLLLGGTPTALSVLLRRRRNRIAITPTHIRATGVALPKDAVTHIFCVGVYDGSWSNVIWHVRVRAGVQDFLLAVTDSLDDANALAALLASELGLPTWVPTQPPAPRR